MEGEQPYSGDLLTMVINHLLTGMILQVWRKPRDPIFSSKHIETYFRLLRIRSPFLTGLILILLQPKQEVSGRIGGKRKKLDVYFSASVYMYSFYVYIYIWYPSVMQVYVCKHIELDGSTYPENGHIHLVRMVKPSRCWERHRDRARGHLKQPGFCLVVEFHPLIQVTQKENSWWFKDFLISFASGYDPNVFTIRHTFIQVETTN